jgi:phosphatidate cytidylyltransferase
VFASLIFAPDRRRLWVGGGIGYAGALLLAPLLLRFDPDYGLPAITLLFAVVWTTDILGFFAGKALGGPKLCPAISPKKTWSGAVAGVVGSLLVAIGLAHLFATTKVGFFSPAAWGILGFVLSAVAQCGDLFESWVKRRFGAKDASQLIPGHGGVMDRLDGFWAAALVGCILGILRGGFHNVGFGLLVW